MLDIRYDMKEIFLPKEWGTNGGTNTKGQETTSPSEVVQEGGLMPLGGTEECAGYKV